MPPHPHGRGLCLTRLEDAFQVSDGVQPSDGVVAGIHAGLARHGRHVVHPDGHVEVLAQHLGDGLAHPPLDVRELLAELRDLQIKDSYAQS